LTRYEQETALKILVAKGFVQYARRGVPARRHFYVDFSKIEEALSNTSEDDYLSFKNKPQTTKTTNKVCGKTTNCKNARETPNVGWLRQKEERESEKKSVEKKKYTEEQIDAFVKHLHASRNIKDLDAYSAKIQLRVDEGHEPTLSALEKFLAKREADAQRNILRELTEKYYAATFKKEDVTYVIHRIELCRDDQHYAKKYGYDNDCVFLECYENGDPKKPARAVFDDLPQLKKFLEDMGGVK
jgi:hypothetical protein